MPLWSKVILAAVGLAAQEGPPSLERQLAQEDPASLARAARELGDPARGALIFHQPQLACAKCHVADEPGRSLGPDLARLGKDVSDTTLIESILDPSKVIRQGFETVTIATDDGKTTTGLLLDDRPDAVILRDPAREGAAVSIATRAIESRKKGGPSLMPAGLANQLASRQEFLDLVRYLREVADKGPDRARALRPDPAQLAPRLPDYERDVDHARLIAGLGAESLKRGEAIYTLVCANCHGTRDKPGSLPTSLRFASGSFKNGADPYAMYRTLTHGFGQMPPQTWMVPRQKYDVIHYIREAYLKPDNPSQLVRVDSAYLARLPKGTSLGPEPTNIEPWVAMDYGTSLLATVEVGDRGANFAYKGIAVRLDPGPGGISRGRSWMVYDHDTMRVAAVWTGAGFIDWEGINFNGRHQVHPRVVGRVHVANPTGPGWADPESGSFDDPRALGRNGKPYGPLPRRWSRYKGFYRAGDRIVVSYSVGDADVLDLPGFEVDPANPAVPIFTRTLAIGSSARPLRMQVAPPGTAVAIVSDPGARLLEGGGSTFLAIPASGAPTVVKLFMSSGSSDALSAFAKSSAPPVSPAEFTRGGPSRWPEVLKTRALIGRDSGPFAVDVLTHPTDNPWHSRMRLSGFDFLDDGRRAAVCDWDGDVWLVDGLDDPAGILSWRRIAAGLFQPLGLKVVDGRIYVACRDQIVRLLDLNGDGETDFYECFNSDHQVTEHFHEFAMGLQSDAEGNFYYAKAACHGLRAVVPQHGTLLRVSKDGSRTDILATGFRAPNGVCVNGDGTFFLTDQEGFWTPKNRINWVKPGGFYGNMWGYHDVTDSSDAAMEPPICWITNAVDRSPAEIVRVPENAWGPLAGSLLSLSYGYGKVFVVPHELIGGRMQGGIAALPIPSLPTGVMRGRFHPVDHQLYACGLFGWAGDREQPGGFYRLRATGQAVHVPIALHAGRNGLRIGFSGPLDPTSIVPAAFTVKTWSLRRTVNYGSEHVDERPLKIDHARLAEDGRSVALELPGIKPTWCMEIAYSIRGAKGEIVTGQVDNTIHRLGD